MSMFHTGLTGLSVARSALMTTAHNTANVHTPGYSRQVAELATGAPLATGSGYFGTGAQVTTVSRSYDRYLTAQLAAADSSAQALNSYGSQINRIDTLLADRTSGLTPLMQSFFNGVQGVANAPADPAARQQLISAAQAMANKFRATDQYLRDLNTSVNDQIVGSASQINTYATQIAGLNDRHTDRFALKRLNIGQGHTPQLFIAQVSGFWPWTRSMAAQCVKSLIDTTEILYQRWHRTSALSKSR